MKAKSPGPNGWEETRQLMNELIKQNLALGHRLEVQAQRMDARLDAFAQRMDVFASRMDRLEERMDRLEGRMQRFESSLTVVIDLLHRLPDAVKEKMGFGTPPPSN